MNGIRFVVTADNRDFIRRMEETRGALRATVSEAERGRGGIEGLINGIEGGLRRIALAGAGVFTLRKAADFARQCVDVRANIQSLEISFETLLQSKEKADAMLKEIKTFAATTPMDMDTLAKGAQTMLGFNIEAEKVMPMLRAIGDISMGNAQKFESLSLSFSQMSATGKLMGQDLLQMINAGFNPLAQISEKTGKSIDELKQQMESGKVTVEMVTDAFMDATGEGGKFHDMLSKQAEGLKGSFAYIRGSISGMMNEIGESVEGPVADMTNLAGDLVKNYKDVAEVIGVLVSMYGAYKAAVMVTVAAEAANSTGTTLLAAAKVRLTAVTARLNAVMMMNPYGIVLAAVVALGYGIYKLSTITNDAIDMTRKSEEAYTKCEAACSKEIQTLNSLNETLKESRKGSDEWKNAKDALVRQFGQYHSGLDAEIEKTGYLAMSYDSLADSIRKSAIARAMDKFDKDNDVDFSDTQKKLLKGLDRTFIKHIDTRTKDEYFRPIYEKKEFVLTEKNKQEIRRAIARYQSGEEMTISNELKSLLRQIPSGITGNLLTDIMGNRRKTLLKEQGGMDIARSFGMSDEEARNIWLTRGNYSGSTPVQDNKSRTGDSIDEEIKDKKEELKKHKTGTDEWKKIDAEISALIEERKQFGDYDRDHKKSTGLTSEQLASKEENAAGKLADILRRQAEERLRIEQDYEYERWQNRIDLMAKGADKVQQQQELNFSREKTELSRRLASELEAELQRQMDVFDAEQNQLAAADKKYAKKVFRDSDIDQSSMGAIKTRYVALQEDLTKAQQKAEADRLQSAKESFNAYLQEFGTYQQKREAMATDYDMRITEAANAGDRMMLEAQKGKALSDLDYQQWIDSGEIALAFGDISNLSQQTISRLIEDMEKYREKVVATFDPEKIEKYEEALNNLRMADVENTFSAFGSMVPEYFTKRLAIQKQINDEAQIGLELTRKQNELSMQTAAQKGAVKIHAKAAGYSISDEDLADPSKVQQIADKVAVASASGNKFASALHSALLELLKLNGESAELEKATKTWDGNFAHLKETLDKLDGEEKFRAISEAVGSAAGLIGDLASQASEMADAMGAEGLGKALGTLGEAMGSVQNVASGFAQGGLVGGIAAAAGEVMKWTSKLFMAGDAKHQKNIERLQEQIDALSVSGERLSRSLEKVFSSDANRLLDQQASLLEQQRALVALQMQEERMKKGGGDKDAIKDYEEKLRDLDDKIADTKEAARDAIFGDDIKSQIEQFASDYSAAWENGESRALSARDTVRKMMRQMVEESIKAAIQGSQAMEGIRAKLEEFFTDGVLDRSEQEYIYGMADRLQKELDMRFAGNESLLRGDSLSQSATSMGWETMSQESADVLTGRFTAFCETSEAIREINSGIAESVRQGLAAAMSQRDLMEEALNIHIISMGHLEAISRNTRELATMREDLQKIERHVRNL